MTKLNQTASAYQFNMDAAQREMNTRQAEGEDMTNATIDPVTYKITRDPAIVAAEAAFVAANADRGQNLSEPQSGGILMAKVNPEAKVLLETLKAEAVEKQITATEALRQVLARFPGISRIQFKHTAALVGINPLTARNTFDRYSA